MNWEALSRRLMQQFHLEDVVQEALLRTQMRLATAEEIRDVEAFATAVARNILRETQREKYRTVSYQVAAPESVTPPARGAETTAEDFEELKRKVLSASERKLFDTYAAASKKQRERLAAKLGITIENLYVKVHRLKQRLIEERGRG